MSLRGKTKRNLRYAIAWKKLKTTHSEDQSEMKATQLLHNLGQSIWLDNITRELLNTGTLKQYVADLSVTGLTSNPTIFDHARDER